MISAGIIGAQYGQDGATFIRLMSDAVEKSSLFSSGFPSMYLRSCFVFFSRSSIVHGRSGESVVGCRLSVVGRERTIPLNGHRKLFRPFIIAMFSGLPSLPRMNFFCV